MRTTYVFDTSTLIYDPCAWRHFPNSDIIIPIAVLNELDKLKKQPGEVGRSARICIRMLDDLSNSLDITTGITLEDDVLLKIDVSHNNMSDPLFAGFGDPNYGDSQILACAYSIWRLHPEHDVVLVSNDINLRVKAKSRGLGAISHDDKRFSVNDIYAGYQIIRHSGAAEDLLDLGHIDPRDYGFKLNPNECVLFESEDGDGLAMGRQVGLDKIKLLRKCYPWGISSRNKEQAFAIDLIMDKNVDLVTLIGKAGTGKSLIVLASALELVISKKEYDKFIIYRPIQPVGNDIGYLPGPQPLDAKIATPFGWTTMGEIKIGDFVIGSDGKSKKVLKTFDKGEKDIFKVIFNDGSFTECCEDHLWYTTSLKESQIKSGEGSVKSLKEIRSTLKTHTTQVDNHKIPMVKPVEFIEQETIISPYIMGVLLGAGTLSEDYSIYFTTADEEVVKNCQDLLPYNMICKLQSTSKTSKVNNYSFINKNNKQKEDNLFNYEINRLGLRGKKSINKFIPDIYKFNSVKNRIALLQGLMDTDGFVSEDGSDVEYYSISDQLSEDFKFLVQSLGGIAHINKKLVKYSFNKSEEEKEVICNVVSLSLPSDICPVRLTRKVNRFKSRKYPISRTISDIIPVGKKEARCLLIESEDHLYATNEFILTHNTMEEKLAPWFQAIMDNFEMLFSNKVGGDWKRDLEMFRKKGRIEMEAITYIRGRSIPNSIILIDECQNLSKEEVKTILTRAGENTKIILTGDIEQIDNSLLDATSNGLTYIIEKFKDSDLAGHITFTQGERSKLASKAAEIL